MTDVRVSDGGYLVCAATQRQRRHGNDAHRQQPIPIQHVLSATHSDLH